jgi:UDP-glucuronate 4-epimerase
MQAIVTGVAGFIGSHLAEALVERGDSVLGIDCFTSYYDPALKRANLAELVAKPGFSLSEADLRTAELGELIDSADAIFHNAAQPGVRSSFGSGFADYCSHNILGTQRLLEAAKSARTQRFVFASSSSIYGNAPVYPTHEDDRPDPISPYGVTKLAAEHLCKVYAANWDLSTVMLRYFTVYGPRQRPDMAIHRLIGAALDGRPFPLYGAGGQVRDFTYVGDVVQANLAAGTGDIAPGTVINISGGASVTMVDLIGLVEELTGSGLDLDHGPPQSGDVERTGANVERAHQLLHWEPQVTLRSGLEAQLEAMKRPHADASATT